MNFILLLWLVCALIGVVVIIWDYESFSEMIDECLENPGYLAFAPRDVWVFLGVLIVMLTSPYLIGYWAYYRIPAFFARRTPLSFAISTSEVDHIELILHREGDVTFDIFENYVVTTNAEVDTYFVERGL